MENDIWFNEMPLDSEGCVKAVTEYISQIPEYGDLISVEEFLDNCKNGFFIDYDGYGYAVKNNMMNDSLQIYPSKRNQIPKDATHICWFNR